MCVCVHVFSVTKFCMLLQLLYTNLKVQLRYYQKIGDKKLNVGNKHIVNEYLFSQIGIPESNNRICVVLTLSLCMSTKGSEWINTATTAS